MYVKNSEGIFEVIQSCENRTYKCKDAAGKVFIISDIIDKNNNPFLLCDYVVCKTKYDSLPTANKLLSDDKMKEISTLFGFVTANGRKVVELFKLAVLTSDGIRYVLDVDNQGNETYVFKCLGVDKND